MSEPVRHTAECWDYNAACVGMYPFKCRCKAGQRLTSTEMDAKWDNDHKNSQAPPPSEVAAPGADDDFKAWEAWNAKPWSSAPHRRGGGVKVFGWMVHRGDCHCPNYPKCSVRFDDLMRERAVRDRYEQLFLTEMRKASQLNKLGQRIAAQRRQIRRLKAALRTAGEK